MSSFGDSNIPITCPNQKCKKDLSTRISDIINRGKIRCSRCNSEIIFSSSTISNIRSTVSELDRNAEEVERAKKDMDRAKVQLDGKLKQLEITKNKLSKAMLQIKDGMQINVKI